MAGTVFRPCACHTGSEGVSSLVRLQFPFEIHKTRSMRFTAGRRCFRLRTATCWRSCEHFDFERSIGTAADENPASCEPRECKSSMKRLFEQPETLSLWLSASC